MKKHNSDCVRLHPAFQAPMRHTAFAIAAAMILGVSPRVHAGTILNCGSNASTTHFSTTGTDPSTGAVPGNGDYTTSAASGFTPSDCVSGASGVGLGESEGTGSAGAAITLGTINGATSAGQILLSGP
ncbi:hypothetical protein ACS0Y6_20085, partial [Burkholderia gladioli]|uniref:hypothetical protein n=1 Tax=Burkholderia gladioli TaxID=28095 RepID=UPI003F7B05D4